MQFVTSFCKNINLKPKEEKEDPCPGRELNKWTYIYPNLQMTFKCDFNDVIVHEM